MTCTESAGNTTEMEMELSLSLSLCRLCLCLVLGEELMTGCAVLGRRATSLLSSLIRGGGIARNASVQGAEAR
jgi:hypothetical protein